MTDKTVNIAVVISHPIQHFCPQYASWSKVEECNIKIFFGSALGYKSYFDPNFNKKISWSNLGLESFEHLFLNGLCVLKPDDKLDAPTLDTELAAYNPDVVITYGYFQPLQRRAYNWAIKNKIKIAYISDGELRQKRAWWKQVLKYFFLKQYFRPIDFFLTVGDANESFYLNYGVSSEKFIRMSFPVDLKTYKNAYQNKEILRREIRMKYKINNNEFIACVVGKLVKWKNQDHIIDAMALLEKKGIFFHLFIIGSGPMLDSWKRKAELLSKSCVHFTGFISIDDLPSYYAASDLYVHPASVEPHSIAISEAIYMGCPVIVSNTCGSYGLNDDVQEGKNGYVYEFGNVEELSNKIKCFIENSNITNSFSRASHELGKCFQQISHEESLRILIAKL